MYLNILSLGMLLSVDHERKSLYTEEVLGRP